MACQQYVEAKEIRQGTFDWEIERYMEDKNLIRKSPEFKVGTLECFLWINGRNEGCTFCKDIAFVCIDCKRDESFNNMKVFKFSLIAANRHFISRDKSFITRGFFPLAILDDYELRALANEFLPNDVLTLRLSWYEGVYEQGNQTLLNLTAEKEASKCLETVSRDFGHLYESKMDTDCVLSVGETQFPAHRQVLAARSEVFAAMFHHDTSESRSGVVNIPDVDESVLSNVLNYIYSGKISGLNPDTAAPMYIAADKYALLEMRDICLDLLKRNLTVQNVCDASLIAHTHREIDLEQKIIVFIGENLEELEVTDEWQNFSKNNSILVIKLLRSALLASKRKVIKLSSE